MCDEENGEIHICTLEYRSIDILLGCDRFGVDADAWSLGVLLLDMVGMPFKLPQRCTLSSVEMTAIIFEQLGTPPQRLPSWRLYPASAPRRARKEWPASVWRMLGCAGVELLNQLLDFDPAKRPTMRDVGAHPYCHPERLALTGSKLAEADASWEESALGPADQQSCAPSLPLGCPPLVAFGQVERRSFSGARHRWCALQGQVAPEILDWLLGCAGLQEHMQSGSAKDLEENHAPSQLATQGIRIEEGRNILRAMTMTKGNVSKAMCGLALKQTVPMRWEIWHEAFLNDPANIAELSMLEAAARRRLKREASRGQLLGEKGQILLDTPILQWATLCGEQHASDGGDASRGALGFWREPEHQDGAGGGSF